MVAFLIEKFVLSDRTFPVASLSADVSWLTDDNDCYRSSDQPCTELSGDHWQTVLWESGDEQLTWRTVS